VPGSSAGGGACSSLLRGALQPSEAQSSSSATRSRHTLQRPGSYRPFAPTSTSTTTTPKPAVHVYVHSSSNHKRSAEQKRMLRQLR
jgi:hypothetical protein